MKKLRKTFMKRVDVWSLCKSDCSPIWFRPVHEKIVLGRLRGRIRRLFDVGAVFRVENDGGRVLFVGGFVTLVGGIAVILGFDLVIFLWDFSGNPLDKCLKMRYTIVKAMRRGMIHDDSTERWRLVRAI